MSSKEKVQQKREEKRIIYQEPVDACECMGWHLFVFKNEELLHELPLEGKSCHWLGRNEEYSDIRA